MAPPLLVRPKPLRPTAPPSPRSPSSLNSGGRHVSSCPPFYEASTGSSSSSNGNSSKTVSRKRSTSTSSSKHHHRRAASPSLSAPPSPSSLVLSSQHGGGTGDGAGLHDYSALEELLSILSAPDGMRASPPILLPPSRTASRNGNGLSRNGSSNYGNAHRRRSSSIALIRAGSPEVPGLLYSPPSRALTRNPFHRHAATAAAFLPSHTPGASPAIPVAFPSFGSATMPVTPVTGGALRMVMGEGAVQGGSGISELAPAFEREAAVGISIEQTHEDGEREDAEVVVALEEGGGRPSLDASA